MHFTQSGYPVVLQYGNPALIDNPNVPGTHGAVKALGGLRNGAPAVVLLFAQHSRGTFTAGQVAAIRRIVNDLGGVVDWGGEWDDASVDEMHLTADGFYGDQTAGVARTLQGRHHLPVTGLIDPPTWTAAWI